MDQPSQFPVPARREPPLHSVEQLTVCLIIHQVAARAGRGSPNALPPCPRNKARLFLKKEIGRSQDGAPLASALPAGVKRNQALQFQRQMGLIWCDGFWQPDAAASPNARACCDHRGHALFVRAASHRYVRTPMILQLPRRECLLEENETTRSDSRLKFSATRMGISANHNKPKARQRRVQTDRTLRVHLGFHNSHRSGLPR